GFRAHGARPRPLESRARAVGSGSSLPVRPVRAVVRGPGVKAAMVGATRGMGRALARRLAERGDSIVLLGREPAELRASAADLEARGTAGPVCSAPLDLSDASGFTAALETADRALGGLDLLVVTGGAFDRQENLAVDPGRLGYLLHVNFTGTAVLCQM